MRVNKVLGFLAGCLLIVTVVAVKSWTLQQYQPDSYQRASRPTFAKQRQLIWKADQLRRRLANAKDPLALTMNSHGAVSALADGWAEIHEELSRLEPTEKFIQSHADYLETVGGARDMYRALAAAIATKDKNRVADVCREYAKSMAFDLSGI